MWAGSTRIRSTHTDKLHKKDDNKMASKGFKKNAVEMFIDSTDVKNDTQPVHDSEQDFTVPKGYRLEKEYKSERMQLLVRPTTKAEIKKAAAAQGISMNDLVNQILDDYVEKKVNE